MTKPSAIAFSKRSALEAAIGMATSEWRQVKVHARLDCHESGSGPRTGMVAAWIENQASGVELSKAVAQAKLTSIGPDRCGEPRPLDNTVAHLDGHEPLSQRRFLRVVGLIEIQ